MKLRCRRHQQSRLGFTNHSDTGKIHAGYNTSDRQSLLTIRLPVFTGVEHYGIGRGCGVGRDRGVGRGLPPGVGVAVGVVVGVGGGVTDAVAVGVAVGLAEGTAVAVAVGVAVAVAVGVGDGVGPAATLTTPVMPKAQCAKQK